MLDPNRRVISKPGSNGPPKVFIGTHLNNAVFKDLSLATFANISLASAKFDDIDFSSAAISRNCSFAGMQIAGVKVKDLFAAYEQRVPENVDSRRGDSMQID